MGTTLQHGIFLPAEGERNCYAGLASNWTILDGVIGGYSSHAANLTIHVTAADKEAWNGKADASALTAHTGNTTIHVTAADKEAWNGKQDALSQTQLDAVNSGIDSSKVQQIATNTSDISSLQSGKANDSDVVHKSGNETISGVKTFSEDIIISNSDTSQNSKRLVIRSSKVNLGDSNSDSWGISFNAGASYTALISSEKSPNSMQGLSFSVRTKDGNDNLISASYRLRIYTDGSANLMPNETDSISFGSSSNKWKDVQSNRFNGLEPSSLSLPSSRGTIDISSYITDLTGATVNNYTPLANGYIVITCNANDVDYIKMSNNLDFVSVVDNTNNQFTSGLLGVWQPCVAGIGVQIRIKASALNSAKFIPCQGNI